MAPSSVDSALTCGQWIEWVMSGTWSGVFDELGSQHCCCKIFSFTGN